MQETHPLRVTLGVEADTLLERVAIERFLKKNNQLRPSTDQVALNELSQTGTPG